MKKFIILIMLFLLSACSPVNKESSDSINNLIPSKINPEGLDVIDSSITTRNLDDYLLRDDVFYCDLRYYSWVLKDGYIPGFTFIPYYDFMATRSGTNAYFKQIKIEGLNEGEVGSFSPIYEESITMLKRLFPQDKAIFLISQSGLESYYMSSLLVQYGYDASKIYNVGGVTNPAGMNPPYKKIGKNFINGNPSIPTDVYGEMIKVDFSKLDITLIIE